MPEPPAGDHRPPRGVRPDAGAGSDPLGKRALFWVPAAGAAPGGDEPLAPDPTLTGREVLFSSAPAAGPAVGDGRGRLTVDCSRCGAVSSIGFVDLVLFALPLPLWRPARRFDRFLTCPACRKRSWVGVSVRGR